MKTVFLFISFCLPAILLAQHSSTHSAIADNIATSIEPQPLLAQAIRLNEALSFLGSSLSTKDQGRLLALQHQPLTAKTTNVIQEILDPYCLALVSINPEARVKVARGPAEATLNQGGWVSFLIKVNNDAGVTAQLEVESPNAAAPLHVSTFEPTVMAKNILSAGQVANRFLE